MIIPQETLDAVIDYLYDDTQALKACSLVSRICVPAARYHLFSNTIIRHDRLGALSTFVDLLLAKTCTIRPGVIRRLSLVGPGGGPNFKFLVGSNHLSALLAYCESLDVLLLQQVAISFPSRTTTSSFPEIAIGRLELRNRHWAVKELQDTVSFFSSTSCAELGLLDANIKSPPLPPWQEMNQTNQWRVPSINIVPGSPPPDSNSDYVRVAYLITRYKKLSSLKTLSIRIHDNHCWTAFEDLLASVGHNVHHLRLEIIYKISKTSVQKALRHCTSLKTFHFHLSSDNFLGYWPNVPAGWPHAAMIGISPPVRCLTFSFGISPVESLVEFWVEDVDATALRRQLLAMSHLCEIEFLVERRPSNPLDAVEWVTISDAMQAEIIDLIQHPELVGKVRFTAKPKYYTVSV